MGIRVALALLVAACGTLPASSDGQGSKLRVLFSGYVDTRPRAAFGFIDGSGAFELEDVPFLQRYAEVSPDGAWLAFDTCKKADRGLDVMRIDGTDPRRLAGLGGDYCVDAVRWSRDGRYVSYGNPLNGRLHTVEVATGVDIPIPYGVSLSGWHTWSPTGDGIAFDVGKGGSRRIDVIDVATWRSRELVGKKQFGTCEVWAPDWSPAGDRIVFTTCKRQLYAVNGDGSELSLLAESAYAPRWAPDGMSIYFLSGSRLMRVGRNGGPIERVGLSPYYGGPFSIGPAR